MSELISLPGGGRLHLDQLDARPADVALALTEHDEVELVPLAVVRELVPALAGLVAAAGGAR